MLDVGIVLGALAVAVILRFSPLSVSGVVQTWIVLPLLLVLPGYAFTTAVFPGNKSDGIDNLERAVLSFGLSMVWLPILLLLAPTPDGLTGPLVMTTTSIGTVVFLAIGTVRRLRLPAHERYAPTFSSPQSRLFPVAESPGGLDAMLSIVLVVSALLAVGGLGYAVAVPETDTPYTSVSLLTENGSESVAGDYPSQLSPGESAQLTLAVDNREHATANYTVLVTFDQVNEAGTVVERTRVRRFEETVPAGQEWTKTHTVRPPPGDRTRLTYLVYRGEPPATPTIESAYRSVYLWMDVGATSESTSN